MLHALKSLIAGDGEHSGSGDCGNGAGEEGVASVERDLLVDRRGLLLHHILPHLLVHQEPPGGVGDGREGVEESGKADAFQAVLRCRRGLFVFHEVWGGDDRECGELHA